jgi:hypothetical protein
MSTSGPPVADPGKPMDRPSAAWSLGAVSQAATYGKTSPNSSALLIMITVVVNFFKVLLAVRNNLRHHITACKPLISKLCHLDAEPG